MIKFNEFLKINERHYVSMTKDKVSSRKSRRSYIENAIVELGYFFIIDENRDVEKSQKEIELDEEIKRRISKIYNAEDFNEYCEMHYLVSADELDDIKRFEVFDKFMSSLKNRYFLGKGLPYARTFLKNNLNENIVVYANGFDVNRPSRVLMAHYDVNTESQIHDNANDNGASIIVLLEYLEEGIFSQDKNILVVFTDGEEFGGQGAKSFSKQILQGLHGNVEWILNLDVIGIGNKVVLEDIKGKLRNKIEMNLGDNVGFIQMPPNDAMYMRSSGIDSICLSIIPDTYWDLEKKTLSKRPEHWMNLHSEKDKWDTISTDSLSLAYDAVKKIMYN